MCPDFGHVGPSRFRPRWSIQILDAQNCMKSRLWCVRISDVWFLSIQSLDIHCICIWWVNFSKQKTFVKKNISCVWSENLWLTNANFENYIKIIWQYELWTKISNKNQHAIKGFIKALSSTPIYVLWLTNFIDCFPNTMLWIPRWLIWSC